MSKALENLKRNMSLLGAEPKKSLGQNFLVSDHVIQKITDQVVTLKPDHLIEIGPGMGALTEVLKTHFSKYSLIELDSKFAEFWRQQNMAVIEKDALQIDWNQFNTDPKVVLVSNLPYQISSTLVIDRSIDLHPLSAMILMFQKEVAQRIKAQHKSENYGILSVIAQEFWKVDNLLEAGPKDFLPPPKVASRVLVFQQKPSRIRHKKQFLKFVKACFLHRRKLMLSNLKEGLALSEEKLQNAFTELGVNLKARAQELNIQQFVDLYQKLGYE